MKTLELKLKKDVFIVDTTAPLEAIEIDDYEFLYKGSELTEEIASELVEMEYDNFANEWFKDYKIITDDDEDDYLFLNAKPSFISAVESKGFYWLEHNVRNFSLYDPRSKTGCHDLEEEDIITKQWQEAEEKTFRNPLIFVKK